MEQLSGLDAAFVYAEAAGAAHVTFFGIYDPSTAKGGTITFEDVSAHVGSRLGADRLFRAVLARVPFDLDHPYWVRDPNFDIGEHLHRLTLPSPGGWSQLCDQVSQLHAQRMDLRRPPWQGYFIDGLGKIRGAPEHAFALCFKVHHSAVDGMTGVKLVNALHDPTPDTAPAPQPDWTPERYPSSLNLLARTVFTYARRPQQLVSAATHSIPLLAKIPGAITRQIPTGHRAEQGPSIDVPHTPFNSHTDASRNFDARDYDLAEVLRTRRLVPNATVNDVVLTGIGGAMRRYLLDKGELPEKSMVTAMALALQTDSAPRPTVNQISVVRVLLGTDIDDPLARLKVVHESSTNSKAMGEELGERVLEFAEFVPGALVVPAIRVGRATHAGSLIETSRIANTLVSTMRGADFPIYLAGAELLSGYGLSPFTQGCGLIHNVISYRGRVFVSINGCPIVLPDIEHYGDCMDASFAELLSSATA
ncbi:wax ester/triacylglycerol synthase family O-acyltransferase [Mycobacterium sp. Y57]|uniref:wax ester/triacylglycerol synthase family O-acyltransferase n=1 Tax=Mycolicibacterium xanthum TaxID=2796469 RepID=UPI001C858DAE|nr:wax ester/triacylglycerol synthase family O-acyltransferase [Mycolicibacterium xanthum]MBX7435226.1 wax ester/triacylglycerol synthase family O-acyltransferase [Mycolicibacterium xanthum]